MRITAPFLDVLEAFVIAAPRELHGWAIIKASHRGGPTVYKILERLTQLGWATARWEDADAPPNRPRRRYYKLTGAAEAKARSLLAGRRSRASRSSMRPVLGGESA